MSFDLVTVFAASVVVVNATVALMKMPALGSMWREVLPWYGRILVFVAAALVSTIAQAMNSGAPLSTSIVLGIGAVGSAVMGHEFKSMIVDAMKERDEERAEARAKEPRDG